jgi:acyl-CoA reductase-like NAD-dependent aldehyde dehydrogenase
MEFAMTVLSVRSFVGGRDISDDGCESVDVINPATGRRIAEQFCCSEAQVAEAVENSDAAFRSSLWQSKLPAERGQLLLRLADLVEERADELIDLELRDTGKPISQLRDGEIPLTTAILRYYAGAADKLTGSVKSVEGGTLALTAWEPYGVVAGILPWNYPLVNAALKVAPALAAGNAIVLKPSIETPLSTAALVRLCIDAGIPSGIVNVVLGSGTKVGGPLVQHSGVKKVSFTGSTAVGQTIQKLAADQMKKVNLECGGKNAILVFADADLERAAQATLISAFVNCGQLCVSCSRLLVEHSIAEDFVALLAAKLSNVSVGDPQHADTLIGPMITRPQYDTVLDYLRIARDEGCRIVYGGDQLEMQDPLAEGLWIQPTILTGVVPGMRVHDEEIFGPLLSVVAFTNEAHAVEISNCVEYGLSGSVWTSDAERSIRVAKALDTGIVWVNSMLSGYPQISLSPHKMSGTGVELGMEGLLAYCRQKSVVLGYDPQAPVGWGISAALPEHE